MPAWIQNFNACIGTPEYRRVPTSVTIRHDLFLTSLKDKALRDAHRATISRSGKAGWQGVRYEDVLRITRKRADSPIT